MKTVMEASLINGEKPEFGNRKHIDYIKSYQSEYSGEEPIEEESHIELLAAMKEDEDVDDEDNPIEMIFTCINRRCCEKIDIEVFENNESYQCQCGWEYEYTDKDAGTGIYLKVDAA